MRLIATSVFVTTLTIATPVYAQDEGIGDDRGGQQEGPSGLQVTLGAGVFVTPQYPGDDQYQISAFPNIAIQYDDLVSVNIQGVEVNVINSDGFKAGPSLGFNFGRDEDGSNPLGLLDPTDELIGLGDVDFTIEAGGFVQYSTGPFSGKLAIRQGVNGHEGLVGEAELKYNGTFSAFGQTGFFSIGPELSYGDSAFNSAFFDITPAQSLASGISEFDADGGLNSVGLGGNVVLPLGNNFSLAGFAGYDRLIGDVADSSLVQEQGSPNQFIGGLFINYTF